MSKDNINKVEKVPEKVLAQKNLNKLFNMIHNEENKDVLNVFIALLESMTLLHRK